jgi:hypothetical protein
METLYNILSDLDIEYIQSQTAVINAYNKIIATGNHSIYFNIQINDSILAAINLHFGLNLTTYQIPMRWIKGDTLPHIDSGANDFENTYLLYLTESPGSFIINNEYFPITKNTGFKFNEGLSHSTINTGSEPRLLLGPMNEFAQPVGSNVFYYLSEADIYDDEENNKIYPKGTEAYIKSYGQITSWYISPYINKYHSGPINAGEYISSNGNKYLYPASDTNTIKIVYFNNETDALRKYYLNKIGYSTSYTVETKGDSITNWRIAVNSTGAPQTAINSGETISSPSGIYYLYPASAPEIKILYFSYENYPLALDINEIYASETNYTINQSGNWTIARNSTGAQRGVVSSLVPITDESGVYYLYTETTDLIKAFYFENKFDIINQHYEDAESTIDYIVPEINGCNKWYIYDTDTIVNIGDTLDSQSDIYYLYPAGKFSSIIYYNIKADADALNNRYFRIDDNMDNTGDTIELKEAKNITRWAISSTLSKGDSRGVYNSGYPLNPTGYYAVYISSLNYYPSETAVFTDTSNPETFKSSYQVETIEGVTSWKISSYGKNDYNGIVSSGEYLSIIKDSPNNYRNHIYYLYPESETNVKIIYFMTQDSALKKNYSDNIGVSTSYTVETINTNSSWKIAINSTGESRGTINSGSDFEDLTGVYYLYPDEDEYKVFYFDNELEIYTQLYNYIAAQIDYVVGEHNSNSNWKISSFSIGTQTGVVESGDTLINDGIYYLFNSSYEEEKCFYYNNYIDAANNNYTNCSMTVSNYIVSSFSQCSKWLIYDPNENQTSGLVYQNSDLIATDTYHLYPAEEFSAINYYNNSTDAAAKNYKFIYTDNIFSNYEEGERTNQLLKLNSYYNWTVNSLSTGSSRGTFVASDSLEADGEYYLYPGSAPCFLEGTRVLCLVDNVETWLPIQSLGPDTIVKTYKHGPKKIGLLGKSTIYNQSNDLRTKDRLYKCSMANYPELNQDLYITGCHSLLVDNLSDIQRKETIEKLNRIFITDDKYRLIACVDSKAEPWNKSGCFNIYHLALEHKDEGMNYGIYVNGGLLVETCAIRTLKNKSNMKLLF